MPALVVAAHPDDEILGLGTLLAVFGREFTIVHVTDGAPRSGPDAGNAGCASWQEYANLRRRELLQALAAMGIPDTAALRLDCPDQQAVFRIAHHARRLTDIFARLRPAVVFTHAYEGGHPDHDATAAAVHAAIHLLKSPCPVVEFAGYHAGANDMECERFLENGAGVWLHPLSTGERLWKRRILDRYASQASVLARFPLCHEPIRAAPRYDFSRAPHDGPLYYDRFDWGVDGVRWRTLARQAFRELEIPCTC